MSARINEMGTTRDCFAMNARFRDAGEAEGR